MLRNNWCMQWRVPERWPITAKLNAESMEELNCYLYNMQCTQAIHAFGISWCLMLDQKIAACCSTYFCEIQCNVAIDKLKMSARPHLSVWWTSSWTAGSRSKCHYYGYGNGRVKKCHFAIKKGCWKWKCYIKACRWS